MPTTKTQTTLSQIIRDMKSFRDPNKYPQARISGFKASHWIGTKTVIYQCMADSLTKSTAKYALSFEFHGVEYYETKVKATMLTTDKQPNGKRYYYEPPIIGSNPVQIRCQCPDFRHRFSWEDKKANALKGNPKKYVPVSPPSGRPPVNPDHVMGFCKHAWSFSKYLLNSHLIQGKLL